MEAKTKAKIVSFLKIVNFSKSFLSLIHYSVRNKRSPTFMNFVFFPWATLIDFWIFLLAMFISFWNFYPGAMNIFKFDFFSK